MAFIHGKYCETRWPLRFHREGKRPMFTRFQVTMIRRRYARGESPTDIAERYETTVGHVCNIAAGRFYGDMA
jgi:hypothetical protein